MVGRDKRNFQSLEVKRLGGGRDVEYCSRVSMLCYETPVITVP
jgi:hypothetical protein